MAGNPQGPGDALSLALSAALKDGGPHQSGELRWTHPEGAGVGAVISTTVD